MNKRISAVALIAAVPLALTASYGFANGTAASDAAHNAAAAQRGRELTAPPQQDLRPFDHAKLSLIQAATDAQKQLKGQTIEARFEMWHGQPSYLIRTFASNDVWQERIDANSGRPIGDATSLSQDELSPQLSKDVTALQNVQTDFARAVNQAEQKDGGKAIMAAVHARSDGSVDYRVHLVKNNRLQVAMIDAHSGQLR